MDIETPQLLLIETYREPGGKHIEWLNDKELMKWSEQQFVRHDFDTQRTFLSGAQMLGTPLVWDIRLKMPISSQDPQGIGETIGSLHAHTNKRHGRADLGIMIGPQHHGKGYAREAWSAVEGYLFHKMGMRKLEAGCVDANVPMLRIMTSLGWKHEGTRENHFCYHGKYHDLVLFGKMP